MDVPFCTLTAMQSFDFDSWMREDTAITLSTEECIFVQPRNMIMIILIFMSL